MEPHPSSLTLGSEAIGTAELTGNQVPERIRFHPFLSLGERSLRRRPQVEPEVLECLSRWSWPGNVRELRSLAERLVVMAGDPIDVDQLPESYRSGERESGPLADLDLASGTVSLREFRDQCEKRYIEAVLEATGWNVSEVARLLGLHRSRLHQKLKQFGTRRP